MTTFAAVMVFFAAAQVVMGQRILIHNVKGAMFGEWTIGKSGINNGVAVYNTVRLNAQSSDGPPDKWYRVVSHTGGPMVTMVAGTDKKGRITGSVLFRVNTMYKIDRGQSDPGSAFSVKATFVETARNPSEGTLTFGGLWTITEGFGAYLSNTTGNGTWCGICRYTGEDAGLVESITFLPENPVIFRCTLYEKGALAANVPIRPIQIRPLNARIDPVLEPVVVLSEETSPRLEKEETLAEEDDRDTEGGN